MPSGSTSSGGSAPRMAGRERADPESDPVGGDTGADAKLRLPPRLAAASLSCIIDKNMFLRAAILRSCSCQQLQY